MMIRFPGGKQKALTLSYDDGVVQDIRLVDILNRHGIKATFNVNSACFPDEDREGERRLSAQQVKDLYWPAGHEVAVHSATHPFLEQLPLSAALNDVMEDRRNLEQLLGTIVRGMAYPFGTYNDALVEGLKSVGIVYSRTVQCTHDFALPTDWLRMPTTCHHDDPRLWELVDRFLNENTDPRYDSAPWLFYLWGHSYEFDNGDGWSHIRRFAETMGGRDDVWYATNIEIYDYVQAYERLEYSADGRQIYNPSCRTVWLVHNRQLCAVGPGEKTVL